MSDPLATKLARLAPEVDVPAAHAVFERHRSRSGPPRWLLPAAVVSLVVAGVVGLLVVTGDDDVPVSPVATTTPADRTLRPGPGETLVAGPDDFEVVLVAETTVGFGNAELVTSADALDRLWTEWDPGSEQPAVDFVGDVVLVMTRPDDACADTITRFDVTDADGVPLWTPLFEVPPGGCEEPLLSWLYVVTINRTSLGERATIRIPAAEPFGVAEHLIEYTAPTDPSDGSDSGDDATVTLTPTDIVLPLPPVGEPALHNTSLGLLWVIQHADGTVSVLAGSIDRPAGDAVTTESDGIAMLQHIVQISESGDTFAAGPWTWDDHGRSTDADRSTDLVGFGGEVRGGEVALFTSDAEQQPGDPQPPLEGRSYPLDLVTEQLGQPMDLEIFPTLSSTGPAWRYFDGGLVVEGGVGRICDVDLSVPVEELDGCDAGGVMLDTLVSSDRPDATVWFGPPILAFQDPFRGFTHVIPLGGSASRRATAGEPPGDARIEHLVIGDSVTLGAAEDLVDRGFWVDATASRQFVDVLPMVDQLVDADVIADEPIVIHLGNNGPIAPTDLDRLLDALDGFSNVILLTVHLDRDWTEPNNALIEAADERPNVIVIDWDELAGDCPGECFASDGIHLTDAGAAFYADTVAAVAGRAPN
jgi:hypothetical protein